MPSPDGMRRKMATVSQHDGSDSIKDLNSPDMKKIKTNVFEYRPASEFAASVEHLPIEEREKQRTEGAMTPMQHLHTPSATGTNDVLLQHSISNRS